MVEFYIFILLFFYYIIYSITYENDTSKEVYYFQKNSILPSIIKN